MSTLDVEIMIVPKKRRCPRPEAPATLRIPRIARLMALAIKFQDMVDRGEVRDYADLARLGYVTRARVTQIMNLLKLAPDIQNALIHYGDAVEEIRERQVRSIVAIADWHQQRQHWLTLTTHGR